MKPELEFKNTTNAVVAHIDKTYGVRVVWRDLPEGVTGDLDGEEIVLDIKNDPETELYVALHLFGHTTQWNTDEELRAIGYERPTNASEEKMRQIHTYEQSASRIGLSILCEIGCNQYQEWLSRFFAADWCFLQVLYTSGQHIEMAVKWDCPVELLTPLPIPIFTPHRFEHRQAFD